MRESDLQLCLECLLTDGKAFPYFKDEYALRILSRVIGDGCAIHELKSGPYKRLLDKPIVREILPGLGGGRITQPDLGAARKRRRPTEYWLSLGTYGDPDRPSPCSQMSRPGMNLVLHLNFDAAHDAAYRDLVGNDDQNWYRHSCHCSDDDGNTVSWARLDIDFDFGEALIEEVQTDWLREVAEDAGMLRQGTPKQAEKWVREAFGNPQLTSDAYFDYVDRHVRPHARQWSEATLAAAIRLLRDEIGVHTIYFHTCASGDCLKQFDDEDCRPPRSIYSKLPERFCFQLTHEAPQMLRKCPCQQVRRRVRETRPPWYVLVLS